MCDITTKKQVDDLSYQIIGAAIEVHKEVGPGLLESVYEKCLSYLLKEREHTVHTPATVPILFKDVEIDSGLRLDMIVDNTIIVEFKAVENVLPIHEAQLLTYLKLLDMPKGILKNFYCLNLFKEGQKTFVTECYRTLPDR